MENCIRRMKIFGFRIFHRMSKAMKRMGKMSSSITYYTILYLFANEINSRSVFWLTFILHTVRISVSNSQKRCIGSNGTISIIIWITICVSISYTDTEHWTLNTDYRSFGDFAFESLKSFGSVSVAHATCCSSLSISDCVKCLFLFGFMPHHTIVFIDLTCLCVWACYWIE